MMAQYLRIVDDRTEDQQRADFLHAYPDAYMACRVEHDWPKLKVGRLPRGISASPQLDGTYLLVMRCRSCGRERSKVTGIGGAWSGAGGWRYREPRDYRAPKGLGLTRSDYAAELYRRMSEEWVQARGRSTSDGVGSD
jgi:hypothetical protein